ncbi:MAG: host-nuclease inhibitor Gam family protein [Verrucomicrobia bacterium]|nr:host-nuclease inhibitor Gam family protein [Verrucomicrobiota bacterium]
MNTPATTPSLARVDTLAKSYALARRKVAENLADLEGEIAALKRSHLGRIKDAAAVAADLQARLRSAVESAPELFVKPRTFSLHGIKVGYQKGKGRLECDDTEKVVERIAKHFPELQETAVRVKCELVKDALMNLDAATLKKLGCTIVDTGDQVIVKAADTETDKLVARLLDEGAKAVEDAA